MAIVVAIALVYLAYVAWRYKRTSPYERTAFLPKAVKVWSFAEGAVIFPGSIWPLELGRPESKAFFLAAHKRSRIVGIAPDVPASRGIVSAVRVVEARREGERVATIVQGVARVRLIAELPPGEWSIQLIVDSEETKDRARLAAQRIRQLALRIVDRENVPAENLKVLESTTDLSELVDVAASVCDLPREVRVAALVTEDVAERFSIVRKALEALAGRG